ncbi:response regulator transcription factor [Variovorax sp. NFACC27]|uniref:response regulator n=1 Tax=unclassified Variovorax TaxID=663243 RepID=UPI00089C8838|nr:response regulator transcription factor [Variovorax sp. YR750]MDP9600995.1 DNA-binding NarL/FixJ family response regulator [Variovorax paradoxus]SEF33529.1 two component transcriptional regulator, LuxR family [Variovorax sp. NFACC28]SEG97327.1 two component transcriptional regulator, LuxR family [Variovorax sp. NFACC29]SFD89970.1 two component transcriptional regulator, LuxR family [Variovorax sp. NFACC26]SFH06140.1 two component transcriptional regulator, LuxR family [Variovorax sp. NFACC2
MQPVAHPIGVLLVDDHQTMLWGLSRLIDGEHPRMKVVGTARCCEDAVATSESLAPDVIVLDLDLDGHCALDILPKLVSNEVSRVVVLTAEREQRTLDLAVLHGARGVMRKDAPAQQVIDSIERVYNGELCVDAQSIGRVFYELTAVKKPQKADPEASRRASLTQKEREIINTVVAGSGASNKALAAKLFVTEHTLRNHLTSIYQKLGVSNRLELYIYAVKHQLDAVQH